MGAIEPKPLLKPLLLILAGWTVFYAGKPVEGRPGHTARMSDVLELLAESAHGDALMARAQKYWGLEKRSELIHFLRWGPVSKTDAVLTRHFEPGSGQERRERRVTIYLRLDQTLRETVLDLAHELVHATSGPTWDPYDPDLTAGKYLHAALEGEGGEVEAVAVECRVARDLGEKRGFPLERCKRYVSHDGELGKERIRRDFYRVGRWYGELRRYLGDEFKMFPLLTREDPALFSSTGRSPYPMALYREYEEINRIACQNSRRRLGSTGGEARAPAAESMTLRFLARRCADESAK